MINRIKNDSKVLREHSMEVVGLFFIFCKSDWFSCIPQCFFWVRWVLIYFFPYLSQHSIRFIILINCVLYQGLARLLKFLHKIDMPLDVNM